MPKHMSIDLWSGVCGYRGVDYDTTVLADEHGVVLFQDDPQDGQECIAMSREEAVDIAFAILRDCAPTIHETLEKLNVKE